MAWYRAGGGGIPSSLKTDMNDVLNKKFGTSQDYPSTDWAPTVNLMGPLPEKTASGTIVTFPDGADAVPLKKCEITLPASLDGYSEVDVVASGKNLANVSADTQDGLYHASVSYPDNGVSVSATGTYSRCAWIIQTIVGVQYTLSYKGVRDNDYGRLMLNDTATAGGAMAYGTQVLTATETAYTKTFTASSNILYLVIYNTGTGTTGSTTVTDIQLEVGSSATDYEPYTAPTTHTADLGRTIYGGTVDVVKGTAEPFNIVSLNRSPLREKINYGITINQQSESVLNVTTNGTTYSCERLFYSLVAGTYTVKFLSTSSDSYTPLISIYRTGGTGIALSINPNTERTFTLSEDTDIDIRLFASGGGDTTIRTVEFTNFQLESGSAVHDYSPYFEPFTFDPVPIDSKFGNNTIWSEQGDTEVTYRADINLALGGQ